MFAEALWNFNPNHPVRNLEKEWHHLEDIPLFKDELTQLYSKQERDDEEKNKPKLGRDDAAIKIQAAFRGYMDRKKPEVMELRVFWNVMKLWNSLKFKERTENVGKLPLRQFVRKIFTERELEDFKLVEQKAFEQELLWPIFQ